MKRMMKLAVLMMLAAGVVFANGTKEEAAPAAQAQTVRCTFGGSSTVAPIVNDAIPLFEKENPQYDVTYETLGSSVGLKGLLDGTLTLAGSSRELKQSELDAGLVPVVIALDGLSVVVNGDVTITNLDMQTLASIFAGEVTNWKDVGGKDEPIVLVVRDETSGTYGTFNEMVLKAAKKELTKNAVVAKENGELAAKVAATPGSIGYCGMAFGKTVEEAGGRVLSLNGIDPTVATVKDGTYPLGRNLYLATKGEAKGAEKEFIDFILGSKGQAAVEESGFIPVK